MWELVPREYEQESCPCLLLMVTYGGLAGAVLESLPWWCRKGRASELTTSATTQAQIPCFELTHSSIYPTYEQLKQDWVVLQIQAAGSPPYRATTGYLSGVPVRIQY